MGEPLSDDQAIDTTSSANSYAILAKLATGGMAELFLARTASAAGVERYLVVKRVLPGRVKDTHFVAMFLDEARLVAQLQHPNIAQVFDTGTFGDSFFFSMEYVHGETVRELIHRAQMIEQPIPIGCALTIIANAAAGLHHAHERLGVDGKPLGIVHRDVSPSNLMVTYEGNVKVVDFGVAKATRRSAETQTGTVKGKIGYLAPEQCRGRASDRRGDLFSLGIILWELLVGDRLYRRANDYDTMEAIVLDEPEPPSKFRAEVPEGLDAVVLKLLAKAPGDRYQTADELHEELERVADATGIKMSGAALKRYVVELFGKRPEPWIEMPARDPAQEIVTVSAAVPGGLDTVLTSLMDSQLSTLPDLTNTPSGPRRTPTPRSMAAVSPPRSPTQERATLKMRQTRRPAMWIAVAGVAAALGAVLAWLAIGRGEPAASPGAAPAVAKIDHVAPPPVQELPKPVPTIPTVAEPERPRPEPPRLDTKKARPAAHHGGDDLATAVRAGKFSDAVYACMVTPKVLAQNIATCTLAACQAHNAANARAWLANVPAGKRDAITAQCAASGMTFETAKAVKPADSCDDPMACRK